MIRVESLYVGVFLPHRTEAVKLLYRLGISKVE